MVIHLRSWSLSTSSWDVLTMVVDSVELRGEAVILERRGIVAAIRSSKTCSRVGFRIGGIQNSQVSVSPLFTDTGQIQKAGVGGRGALVLL